jgi:hypothetical protein
MTSSQVSATPGLTTTQAPSSPQSGSSADRTGAIVGGTIVGVAILIALIAFGIYFWRRRRNVRRGPGINANPQSINPMSGPASGFAPLDGANQGSETGLLADRQASTDNTSGEAVFPTHPVVEPLKSPDSGKSSRYGGSTAPPQTGYRYPGQYPAAYATQGGAVAASIFAPERIPLTTEIDHFSRGFSDVLGRIGEEEEYEIDDSTNNGDMAGVSGSNMNSVGGASTSNTHGARSQPLWQQNRRRGRNLMWV